MDVYQILPNDTDLTVFKQAGMGGLNFAFGAGLAYYHTPEDTPENLDQRTLQHQGENALATARHLGRLDLDDTKQEDVIYTSILSRTRPVLLEGVDPAAGLPRRWPCSSRSSSLSFEAAEIGLADLAVGAGVVFLGNRGISARDRNSLLAGHGWSVLRDVSKQPIDPLVEI